MKKNIFILSGIILASVLLPTGCNKNQSSNSRTYPSPYQSNNQYSDGDYEVWVGPGWYHGSYYSREGHYTDWRRRHYRGRRGYGSSRHRRYHSGRSYHRGGRGHRGGGGRHGGGGRRGGGGRGRR